MKSTHIPLAFFILLTFSSTLATERLSAADCTAGTIFNWTSGVLRWGGNDVWSFGGGYVSGYYWMYWRPRAQSTMRLNGSVLYGRQNVVSTASYGQEVVNEWHDAPQSTGPGLYSIENYISYLPDDGCDAGPSVYDEKYRQVYRPSISGLGGVWLLNGLSDPNNGYYNQVLLSSNKNCLSGDTCAETPYWSVTQGNTKISLNCTACSNTTAKSESRSNSLGDIAVVFNIGGFESAPHSLTVAVPCGMTKYATPADKDETLFDGYHSFIYYRNYDQFGWVMNPIALNEQFGSFANDQSNNWAKPTAFGVAGFTGYTWWDNMFFHSCPACTPPVQNPTNPLGNAKIDHASQQWRLGSATVGAGVHVQTNVHQRFQDHGRHTVIQSPIGCTTVP